MQTFQVVSLRKWIRSAIIIFFPLLVGAVSAFLTRKDMVLYQVLVKPPFSPPSVLFPIAWTVLYLLMGIASLLILRKDIHKPNIKDAMTYFWFQLALNFLWPIVFFHLRALLFAFFLLLAMWLLVGICTAKFYRISHAAGWLMVPLFLWTTFAGYLNLAVWILNR